MPGSPLPRRWFLASAGSLAAWPVGALAVAALEGGPAPRSRRDETPKDGTFPVKAIASANGLEATRRACELIRAGSDPLDAAVAGVTLVEDDPADTSVGYGGLPNEEGTVELDAAVMHGPTHRGGAVAALRGIRHPSRLARLVLEQSDHVLLVGEGALRFAKAHGFQEENLLTEKARKIWLYWRQTLSDRDAWLPPDDQNGDPEVLEFFRNLRRRAPRQLPEAQSGPEVPSGQPPPRDPDEDQRGGAGPQLELPTGTVHLAAMNASGGISCVTSTSGLAFKMPGRVGDSPIIGAGLYVDNAIGSCGSTGRGEANLQDLCSFAAVELMRDGMPPEEAGLEVLRRVAAHTEPRLRDAEGRPDFGLRFYLLAKDGRHAGVSMWGPAEFAVTDDEGTRREPCASLYER